MSNFEIDAEVAAATGDTESTIRRYGFSMFMRRPFELEPDDLHPPQAIDWDTADPYLLSRFIDEIID